MTDQQAAIPEDMQELHRRLEAWRGSNPPRSPLPNELWTMAVGLAQRYNVHRVARTFGLDYSALKRRMPGSGSDPKPVATFVELLAPPSGSIAECSMEIESANGAKKLRIQMKGVAPAGLAAVIRGITG
jgi:hypothetical protein